MSFLVLGLLSLAVYGLAVVIVNRGSDAPFLVATPATSGTAISENAPLHVLTWNLGYAGLGAESDFFADKGRSVLAPSRAAVAKNLEGIANLLGSTPADVYLLQEVAIASPLNYATDVKREVDHALPGRASSFVSDVRSRLIPWPLRFLHGTEVLTSRKVVWGGTSPLTADPKFYAGLIKRQYRLQIARLPIAGSTREWVIANVHLSAFDKDAELRNRQLADVFAFCSAEFAKGNYVIAGGDWNLEFRANRFAHETEPRFMFWLSDFPWDRLPEGWTMAFDEKVPTVRTAHRPYLRGKNYVTIIDGFLASPNVSVRRVAGIDQDFAYSDHNPVLAEFAPAAQ